MTDYIIVISILSAFFVKQLESYYDEKFKNANDSYLEAKILEKTKRLKFLFGFITLVLVLAVSYWVYKLDI